MIFKYCQLFTVNCQLLNAQSLENDLCKL